MSLETAATLLTVVAISLVAISRYIVRNAIHPTMRNPPTESILVGAVPERSSEFLTRASEPGSFLVFLVDEIGSDGGAGFSQISIEDDGVGVDQVFTCEVNKRRAPMFREHCLEAGYDFHEREENDVLYLRVLPDDPRKYCQSVLLAVFEQRLNSDVHVIEYVT